MLFLFRWHNSYKKNTWVYVDSGNIFDLKHISCLLYENLLYYNLVLR